MAISKGLTRLGSVAAMAAVLLSVGLFGGSVANAQTAPAVFWGGGLTEGDTVEIMAGETSCGTATVDAEGGWSIQIDPDTDCGVAGTELSFYVNGAAANETATWAPAASPADEAVPGDGINGMTLTIAEGGEVTPPDTGNAGLIGGGSSAWLAMALGVIALGAVAGVRTATGRSR